MRRGYLYGAMRVRHADHGAFGDSRMFEQHRFDLRTRDVVAGGNDHVVGAGLVPEIALVIHRVSVACDVPAADDVIRLARIGEIATARRAADGEAARRVSGDW